MFGLSDQLKQLSDCGDPLETMSRLLDFEIFSPAMKKVLVHGDGQRAVDHRTIPWQCSKRGPAAQNTVSDARMEFLIRDRLSWRRFLGFDLRTRSG